MAINFNGTTLSAMIDAVRFNGTVVSKVMFNGSEVWTKLNKLNWSGNSYVNGDTGISVSGNLFRAYNRATPGAWMTAVADGTFTGNSSAAELTYLTSGNLIRIRHSDSAAGAWVTYTLANKSFTGSSTSTLVTSNSTQRMSLQTSGGLIRSSVTINTASAHGAYISLK